MRSERGLFKIDLWNNLTNKHGPVLLEPGHDCMLEATVTSVGRIARTTTAIPIRFPVQRVVKRNAHRY